MGKIIIDQSDTSLSEQAVTIEAPKYESEEAEIKRGPTKEEIEKKIDDIKKKFEEFKDVEERSFNEYKAEKIREAENEAFNIVKKAVEEYETKIAEANIKYKYRVDESKKEGDKITSKALGEVDSIQDEAAKVGYNKGKDEGVEQGYEWAKSAIKKLNIILSSIAKERLNLIFDAKLQLTDIIVIMARRMVNALIENQPRVVYDNIMSVLKNLKGRAEIEIRVNGEDLNSTSKHKREFLQMMEGIEKIKITEDNSVDKGGVIIDTEYGSVDSRIVTQMQKIEDMIRKDLKEHNLKEESEIQESLEMI